MIPIPGFLDKTMNLINPSFEIWDRTDPVALVERAGRVCYQSEPKGESGKFVKSLITRGHLSVLEHAWFAVRGCDLNYLRWPWLQEIGRNGTIYGNARAWREASLNLGLSLSHGLRCNDSFFFGLEEVNLGGKVSEDDWEVRDVRPITVNFIVDRGVSHEIVRHRASFSQESTRFCNYGGGVTFIIPSWMDFNPGSYLREDFEKVGLGASLSWFDACLSAEDSYLDLLSRGWIPQQARSVLPNSLKTQIVVTASRWQWVHIFALRCDTKAHPQMREVMIPLQKELEKRGLISEEEVLERRGELEKISCKMDH